VVNHKKTSRMQENKAPHMFRWDSVESLLSSPGKVT